MIRRASLLALALFLCGVLRTTPSRADTDPLLTGTPSEHASDDAAIPRPMLGLAAGAATSFVSLALGTTFLARAETRTGRNRGLLLGQGGMSLSPFLAHAVVGEFGRGALFSIVPVLGEIGMAALVSKAPNIVTTGGASEQFTFIALLATTVLASGAGVVDVAYADDRAAAATRKKSAFDGLRVTPIFGHGLGGLSLGGIL